MTIESNYGTRVDTTGNGVQTVFNYNFENYADADIIVAVNGATQVLNSDYTLAYTTGQPNTGVVTFAVAPGNGLSVVIRRAVDPSRSTDFSQLAPIYSGQLNTQLDRIVAVQQENAASNSLVLSFDPNLPVTASPALPSPTASKFLRWNASANALENADLIPAGSVASADTITAGITRYATPVETAAEAVTNAAVTPAGLAGLYVKPADISQTLIAARLAQFILSR